MNLIELTEYIVKSMVKNPDSVAVKEFETEEENTILLQVLVAEEDAGAVIGRKGSNAQALRTIIQATSSLKENKRIKINIDTY